MADTDGGRRAAANFSRNIKARREAIGMSQEHLAEAMTARGFGFTQATVWKVESGQRGVSLTEGLAIAEILSEGRSPLSLAALTAAPEIDEARQALEAAGADLVRAADKISTGTADYVQAARAHAAAFRIAADRTPPEARVGAIWQWTEPTAPELVALAARLRAGGAADDAVLDATTAFEQSLSDNDWSWHPWQPDELTKGADDDGQHYEAS
jgi:transcriptional regulator with XRE-family HTH domain